MKPLPVLESAETFDLPDDQVLVLGDTHGSTLWAHRLRDRGCPRCSLPSPLR
ncbi:hypothetical protein [Microbacterium sp. NPDC096154]|uniref:hypothetical protein n=1 Tax=Microbacterium sp. NPDC096154 TaxID=3155549 RepID=UPI0033307430